MKVLSLFDGISCGRVALERARIEIERYVAFENDKYAIKVSQSNYPDIEHRGEITADTDFSEFEGFDMVIGGSPCTYWSIAKNNRETTCDGIGFELFMHFVRAVKQTKCKWFLYENNHSIHKDIKAEITKALGVDFIMINSSLLSAQQRKRCYWTNVPNVEQPKDRGILLRDILESGIQCNTIEKKSKTLLKSYSGANSTNVLRGGSFGASGVAEPIRIGQYGKGGQAQRIYSITGKSVTLSANGGGGGAKTGLYKIDLTDGDYTIRKLTPIEAERLQTLDDNYTSAVSNSQRYKCIGNGWSIDIIVHILKNIK